jgi:hypothetical protein
LHEATVVVFGTVLAALACAGNEIATKTNAALPSPLDMVKLTRTTCLPVLLFVTECNGSAARITSENMMNGAMLELGLVFRSLRETLSLAHECAARTRWCDMRDSRTSAAAPKTGCVPRDPSRNAHALRTAEAPLPRHHGVRNVCGVRSWPRRLRQRKSAGAGVADAVRRNSEAE